jgi:hypothetical protein
MTYAFHARRLRVNLGGELTKTTGLGAVLCRKIEKSRFYRPQSQNRQSADIARKRRNGPVKTDARPSRDGSERLGPGTQAYGQI